jgi:hypothetical protein
MVVEMKNSIDMKNWEISESGGKRQKKMKNRKMKAVLEIYHSHNSNHREIEKNK